jgi:hypothetical protein
MLFLMVHQMGDCRKAEVCAVGCKEDAFVEKENVNCQFYILMELNELCRNFDNALHYPIAIPPHCVTFHLEDGASPIPFCGLYILECTITTWDTTCADNCPGICRGRENHLFKQILCLSSTGNLLLAKKFHFVFDSLDKSKLTHLLWVANVQTTRMHLKEEVRETKLLMMDVKGHFSFAIICDPINLDKAI